ncbi:MAG TPA: TIGR04283 family arsenosugar biosynthesis glycosyltransferase [Ginsengibacter sp.]
MKTTDGISIIIPAYNESECIADLIRYLKLHGKDNIQIIVSDGGSSDDTISIASHEGVLAVKSPKKGRAAQMNYGASLAKKDILYFVHADCFPPENFYNKIIDSKRSGFLIGRFQTKFKSNSLLLKMNAFFTRFDWFICSGGDQTLYIAKEAFNKINGFNDSLLIMEDYEFVKRARIHFQYAILKDKALISARKYANNSWLQVQKANYTIIKMYNKGIKQEVLVARYKQMLNYR